MRLGLSFGSKVKMYLMLSYLDSNFSDCWDARPRREGTLSRLALKRDPFMDGDCSNLDSLSFLPKAVPYELVLFYDSATEPLLSAGCAVSGSIIKINKLFDLI